LKEPEVSPARNNKDENAKPENLIIKSSPLMGTGLENRNGFKLSTNLLEINSAKNEISKSVQPILNSLSTTLKPQIAKDQRSLKEQMVSNLPTMPAPSLATPAESLSARLTTSSQFMSSSTKLLDENLQWQENLMEYLVDQTDFLVVGVFGKKGCGKSTLMSLLGGSKFEEIQLFKPAGKEARELAQHKSNGK
jgi:hypothetical protein